MQFVEIEFTFTVLDFEQGVYKGKVIQVEQECIWISFFDSFLCFKFGSHLAVGRGDLETDLTKRWMTGENIHSANKAFSDWMEEKKW